MSTGLVKSTVMAALGASLFFLLSLPITMKLVTKAIPSATLSNGAPSLIGVAIQTVVFFAIAFAILFSLDRIKKQ